METVVNPGPTETALGVSDLVWLQTLADIQDDTITFEWLKYMNERAESGSHKAVNSYPESKKQAIHQARQDFYGQLPSIKQALDKSAKRPLMPKPKGFIEVARALSIHGVDLHTVSDKFPELLFHKSHNLEHTLELLESSGIQSLAVNKFPRILSLSTKTLASKVQALSDAGLDAAHIINIHPSASLLTPQTIEQKQAFYESNGLDFARVISGNPRLLTFSSKNIKSKLNVLFATAKKWGAVNYRTQVKEVVERWPTVLTYSRPRLRTMAKIASYSITELPDEGISQSNVSNSIQTNLEAALAAYLSGEIHKPQDIYRLGSVYKALGEPALKDIIKSHPQDPVVKYYLRYHNL